MQTADYQVGLVLTHPFFGSAGPGSGCGERCILQYHVAGLSGESYELHSEKSWTERQYIGSLLKWRLLDPIGGMVLSLYIIFEWVKTLLENFANCE